MWRGQRKGPLEDERPKSREETPKVGSDTARHARCIAALDMGLFGVRCNGAATGAGGFQQIMWRVSHERDLCTAVRL